MPNLAVTDAHPLLWYTGRQLRKLGTEARRLYERTATKQATIFVPTLVLAEVSEAFRAGKVQFPAGFHSWVRQLMGSGGFVVADLTLEVIEKAEGLYAIPERTDRLIAATAAQMDLPLISRDPEIAAAAGVEVVW